jgi:hypothetical protein
MSLRRRVRTCVFLPLVAGCVVAGTVGAQDASATGDAAPPAAVQEKLRQWVETKRQTAEEAARWEEEKRALADLNGLRRQESAQLDALIEAAGRRLTEAEQERSELLAEEARLRASRSALEVEIFALEDATRDALKGFPQPLLDQVAGAAERITAADPERDLQSRFRDVLTILAEAESFAAAVTLDFELRDFGGEEVEVEVLYLGLARGYFTDRSGRLAGTVDPGDGGWVWTERPGVAASVRRAIAVHQKRAAPSLVRLPVKVDEPEGAP